MSNKVGAVYCVYGNSGFLEESILRVYPAVEKVFILLNTVTWEGAVDQSVLKDTYMDVLRIPDPEHKIVVISQYWANEAVQRNFGTQACLELGLDWALVIDDDELYNTRDLQRIFPALNADQFVVYLIQHQLYWKNRETILECAMALPAIVSTIPDTSNFHTARMVNVAHGKNWFSVAPTEIICHNMSYVRSDDAMLRKIQSFSHAKEIVPGWYENIWLKWYDGMENIHPQNPVSFKRTYKKEESPYKLEPLQ
jgi:hypothetical protein